MSQDVPLHLSRFYPQYKFSHLPPTPMKTLLKMREVARAEGVNYVYIGNVPGEKYEDTICPKCGKTVIERIGYDINDWHLDLKSCCEYCGLFIPIVGKREHHRNRLL
jgi:pyruvate formate lyase activating enzyme